MDNSLSKPAPGRHLRLIGAPKSILVSRMFEEKKEKKKYKKNKTKWDWFGQLSPNLHHKIGRLLLRLIGALNQGLKMQCVAGMDGMVGRGL